MSKVLIIGGSRGIGAEAVRQFRAAGHDVVFTYHRSELDADALREQLEKAGCPERALLPFQKAVLEDRLPFTIGGGIGQSRICMFFLRKAHIGEVHSSIWPHDVVEACEKAKIALL